MNFAQLLIDKESIGLGLPDIEISKEYIVIASNENMPLKTTMKKLNMMLNPISFQVYPFKSGHNYFFYNITYITFKCPTL